MYHLLIVDDESAVVDTLAETIEWNDIGIEEVYKAYSGKQAYQFLDTYRIDIVILDIQMPGITGLELAKNIKNRWSYSKVIMLTGYSEFEYAKDAIDFGVFCYLTKPTPCEEIKEVVKHAIKKIEDEWEQLNALKNAETQLNEMLPIFRERYLNAWITQGQLDEYMAVQKIKACRLHLVQDKPYCLVMISIDEHSQMKDEDMGIQEIAMKSLIKDILLKGADHIVFKDLEENYVILVQEEQEARLHQTMKYVEKMAVIFQKSINRSLGCIVSILWNAVMYDFSGIHQTYVQMATRNRRKLCLTTGVIIGPENEREQEENKRIDALFAIPSFLILLESNQKEKAIQRVHTIFREVERKRIASPQILLEIYYMIAGNILQEVNKRGLELECWGGDQRHLGFYSFEDFKSVLQFKEWCISITGEYMDYIEKLERNKGTYLIEEAKQIIHNRLEEQVSLSDIASSLFIHPNYLSSLFKEQTGISITDYIVGLKIDKAKQLLRISGTKVYEVAEMVGYESVPSFNRIFRRIVGVTPKEYQSTLIE